MSPPAHPTGDSDQAGAAQAVVSQANAWHAPLCCLLYVAAASSGLCYRSVHADSGSRHLEAPTLVRPRPTLCCGPVGLSTGGSHVLERARPTLAGGALHYQLCLVIRIARVLHRDRLMTRLASLQTLGLAPVSQGVLWTTESRQTRMLWLRRLVRRYALDQPVQAACRAPTHR